MNASSLAAAPIPEDSGGPYVIAAYLVFLVLIAVYVAIMAQRLTKIARSADELQARLDRPQGAAGAPAAAGSTGAGAVQGDVHSGATASVSPSPGTTAPDDEPSRAAAGTPTNGHAAPAPAGPAGGAKP